MFLLMFIAGVSHGAPAPESEFTFIDRYGLPPTPAATSVESQRMQAFMKQTKKGGELKLTSGQFFDLIFPSNFKSGAEVSIAPMAMDLVYERLMRPSFYGSDRTLWPVLARSVSYDRGQKAFTVRLREGVHFSDGSVLTADDVVNSWRFLIDQIGGPAWSGFFDKIFGAGPTVKKISPNEVYVQFGGLTEAAQRDAVYRLLSQMPIVKARDKEDGQVQIPFAVLGTGPYQVTGAARDKITFARRADYWDSSSPYFNFDRVSVVVIADPTVQRQALLSGLINYYSETKPGFEGELDPHLERRGLKRTQLPITPDQINSQVIHMNMSRPHLSDLRFREALTLALDDESMEQAFKNFDLGRRSRVNAIGETSSFAPKGEPNAEVLALLALDPDDKEVLKPFSETPMEKLNQMHGQRPRLQLALQLLKEAGYVLESGQLTKDGKPVRLSLLDVSSNEQRYSLLLRDNLKKIGIELDFALVPDSAAELVQVRSNNYDLIRAHLEIPRDFSALDPEVILDRLSSDGLVKDFPKTSGENYSALSTPVIDHISQELRSEGPTSPHYPALVDALLRVLSARVPFLLVGEIDSRTVYTAKDICLPPIAEPLDTGWSELVLGYYCP